MHSLQRGVPAAAMAFALAAPVVDAQTSTTSSNVAAQDGSSQASKSKKKVAELQTVVVTGSRIPRTEVEGPTPVQVITGEQIKNQGFTTVYEVMDSLTQVGRPETPPSWGSTSVNARQLNLRNLGPGRSLLLIDGHRVTDYPMAAGGKANFQNYNNIPSGMIDRIEILGAGASSNYVSDAIAGVVNIILRKHFTGVALDLNAGVSGQGDADQHRATLSFGHGLPGGGH